MTTAEPRGDGLLPETNLIAFQAIGLEVTQRLGHLVHASLAGSSLLLPYYIWGGDRRSSVPSPPWAEIVKCWGGLDEEAVHEFAQEWPRAIVVAGMAILESFFKGMMQFGRKVVHGPTGSSGPSPTPRGKVCSEGVYGQRLDKLRVLYGLPLSSAEALLPEIKRESPTCATRLRMMLPSTSFEKPPRACSTPMPSLSRRPPQMRHSRC
jgi:hypothetical protein